VTIGMALNDNPKRIRLFLVTSIAIGLTLVSGLVYGRWTQRWGATASLAAAAKRVEAFPRQLGSWRLMEDRPMADQIVEMLQCEGHVNRRYVNENDGSIVNVALIVGPPGPTAVHTPEICFSSQAYEIEEDRQKKFFKTRHDGAHSLWTTTFRSSDLTHDQLRVYYGWSEGEQWEASRSPRFEYGGSALLYKLQVSTVVMPVPGSETSDSCQDFIETLLREYWVVPGAQRVRGNMESSN
jgi:hypothetical protein